MTTASHWQLQVRGVRKRSQRSAAARRRDIVKSLTGAGCSAIQPQGAGIFGWICAHANGGESRTAADVASAGYCCRNQPRLLRLQSSATKPQPSHPPLPGVRRVFPLSHALGQRPSHFYHHISLHPFRFKKKGTPPLPSPPFHPFSQLPPPPPSAPSCSARARALVQT